MKKKFWIIAVVVVLALLLIPVPGRLDDGGTVVYKAVLYEVQDLHRVNSEKDDDRQEITYIEGIIIEILGVEVYCNIEE